MVTLPVAFSEFQSPDGDFVYSDGNYGYPSGQSLVSFNPLTGISSILTGHRLQARLGECDCFNPLTGISSILTSGLSSPDIVWDGKFQSPDGDFVYSD